MQKRNRRTQSDTPNICDMLHTCGLLWFTARMSEIATGTKISETINLVSATEAARMLDVSSAAVRKMADRGDLTIAQKLPGRMGMYLFEREVVEAQVALRRAELEAKLARMGAA